MINQPTDKEILEFILEEIQHDGYAWWLPEWIVSVEPLDSELEDVPKPSIQEVKDRLARRLIMRREMLS